MPPHLRFHRLLVFCFIPTFYSITLLLITFSEALNGVSNHEKQSFVAKSIIVLLRRMTSFNKNIPLHHTFYS